MFPWLGAVRGEANLLLCSQELTQANPASSGSIEGPAVGVRPAFWACFEGLPPCLFPPARAEWEPDLVLVSVPACILLPLCFHLPLRWSHTVRNRGQIREGACPDHTSRWGQRGWSQELSVQARPFSLTY